MKLDRLLNFGLVIIIAGAIAIIGTRLLSRNKTTVTEPPRPSEMVVSEGIKVEITPDARAGHSRTLSWKDFKNFSDSQWDAAQNDPNVSVALENETGACKLGALETETGFPIVDLKVADMFKTNQLRAFTAVTTWKCFRVGLPLSGFYFGENLDENFITHIGQFKVDALVNLNKILKMSKFLDLTGLNRFKADALLASKNIAHFIRLNPDNSVPLDLKRRPNTFELFKPIAVESLPAYFKFQKSFTVIDVRSPEDRARAPILNSVQFKIDRIVNGKIANEFDWSAKIGELKFDPGEILPQVQNASSEAPSRNEAVLVIGASDQDGRTLWALRPIARLGYSKVMWLIGDIEAGIKLINGAAKNQ
jgi:hypothetical protein